MTLLASVRRAAARRGGPPPAAAAPFPADAWREAESALVAEVRASPRRARPLVDAFARLARTDGSAEARGRAARLRGSWLSYVGRDRDAVAPYREAARRLTGLARDGARLGLAASLTRLSRFAAARRICAEVRRDARERGDAAAVAAADLNEGVARQEAGDLAGAIGFHRRARDGFAAAGRAAQAAAASDNLGNACVSLDRFDEAEAAYAAAAEGFGRAGAPNDAARCRMNRASLLVATDRLGEADEVLRGCEDAFRAGGDPLHAALARRDRGEALLRAGLVPEARHALATAAKALSARTAGAPRIERDRTAALAARAALAAGDPAAARRAARGVGDRAAVLDFEGRAAAFAGRFAGASATFVRAAERFGRSRPAGRARALAAAAWCAAEAGDDRGARRLAVRADRAAARLPVPSVRFAAAATRFTVEARAAQRTAERTARHVEHRAAADSALARAASELESVREGLGPEAMRAALLRGREAWLASAVRFVLDGPGGARGALAFLERWRARALVDLLADAGGRGGAGSDRVAAIRRVVAGLERRAEGEPTALLRAPREPSPSLLRRLREAEEELITATAHGGGRAPAPTEADLDAVRAALPDGALLVALFADAAGGVAFAADRDGVAAVRGLAAAGDVAHAVRDLHFTLGAVNLGPEYAQRHGARLRRAADAALARLAAGTLGPLADRLDRATRLFVVPHGAWHHVPFAALPWRGGRLADALPVTLLPAAAALRGAPAAATGRSVVVSVPDAAAPETRVEGARVSAALGAVLLDGDAATAGALAALDRPACLHVAAHGRHRPDAPAASGVRLADGWFRAAEFAHLRLAGSLVVLSGCETGLGAVDAGDEVHGLVRGVLAAGASDVVSSLWRVDDAATARLMERFHALRAAGAPVASALAAAQREQSAAGAHPWLWAGFVHHARR